VITLAKGHPLLLKLAASWTKETYDSRVDDRAIDFFTKLFTNYTGNPKAGVTAIFGVIFEALPLALQELLCRVSVYRLPIDGAMAQAMQPHIKALQEETLKNFKIDLQNIFSDAMKTSLQALCDRGLLLFQDERFVLHPLVAGLVRSRVTGEVQREAHERAIGYFKVNFQEDRINGNLESCRAELEYFHHACEIRDYERAFSTYCDISKFLHDGNFNHDHIELLELLIEQWGRQEGNLYEIGFCLGHLSHPYNNLGNYQKAIEYSFQCLDVMQSINDQSGISVALTYAGSAYASLGDHQKAIECHFQSLEIDRARGNRNGEGGSLCNIGIAYDSLGDHQQAIEFYHQALPIQREVGNREFEANSLNALGNAYKSLGDYQKAIDFHSQSLQINQSIGNKSGIASSLGNLGSVYRAMGNHLKAINLYSQSLEIEQTIDSRVRVASSLGNLGTEHRSLGNHQKAIDFHFQSLELYKEIGHQNDIAICLTCLGNAYCDMGEYQKAIDFYSQSIEIAQTIGDKKGIARSLGGLGSAYSYLVTTNKRSTFILSL
jgi:tetratricopeptide (TPR) repeat protein